MQIQDADLILTSDRRFNYLEGLCDILFGIALDVFAVFISV